MEKSTAVISAAKAFSIITRNREAPGYVMLQSEPRPALWMWTAAKNASVNTDQRGITISLPFQSNDTHYLIIRGMQSFNRILIGGIEIPASNRFEKADTHGWLYNRAERALLLKIKSSSPVEQLRIEYQAIPRQVPAQSTGTVNATETEGVPVIDSIPEPETGTTSSPGTSFEITPQ